MGLRKLKAFLSTEVIAQSVHNVPAYILKTRAPYFVFRSVRRHKQSTAGCTRMSIIRART